MLAPRSERLHVAHRSAIAERLRCAGMTAEEVEDALVTWEAVADAEGRDRGRAAYRDGAEAWCLSRSLRR